MENNMQDIITELQLLNQTHKQISGYLRILVQPELEKRLKGIFSSSEELKAYELSDGNRSTRDISGLVNLNKNTISDLWKKWSEMGIAESTGIKKPYKAKYSIIDLATIAEKSSNGPGIDKEKEE